MRMTIKTTLACVVLLLLSQQNVSAQSWSDLLNKDNISKVVNAVTGANNNVLLEGTWIYNGSAVQFESENLLLKAGGVAAAKAAESKLDEQLTKFGITPGSMTFTFAADSTFTSVVAGRTMPGTYTYDSETKKLNLKFARLLNMGAEVNYSTTSMDMLFNSDKLLKLITYLSSKTSSTALKSISTLSAQYDGMLLGFELKKQE